MKKQYLLLTIFIVFLFALSVKAETPPVGFNNNLTVGSTGYDVVRLQTWLVQNGYLTMPNGVAMGYFGGLTRAALVKFQLAQGIKPPVGYFGPITRGILNALSKPDNKIKVIFPNGGEVWKIGSTQSVRWITSIDPTNSNYYASVYLVKKGESIGYAQIKSGNFQADNQFTFELKAQMPSPAPWPGIPVEIVPGGYQVQIVVYRKDVCNGACPADGPNFIPVEIAKTISTPFTIVSNIEQTKITPDVLGNVRRSLPGIDPGALYSAYLIAEGFENSNNIQWQIISGSLPNGLNLYGNLTCPASNNPCLIKKNWAKIQGEAATQNGPYNFTVKVSDETGKSVVKQYTLTVTDIIPVY